MTAETTPPPPTTTMESTTATVIDYMTTINRWHYSGWRHQQQQSTDDDMMIMWGGPPPASRFPLFKDGQFAVAFHVYRRYRRRILGWRLYGTPSRFGPWRYGTAEAWLFYVWLLGKEGEGSSKDCSVPSNVLLQPEDFSIVFEPEEYLAALCDLTADIGCYAVHKGMARDVDAVKRCLEANAAIMVAIWTMERWPSSTGQKLNQLLHSVKKIKQMTYEMSLSEAAGRKVATTIVPLALIITALVKLEQPEIVDLILPAPVMPRFPSLPGFPDL
jgi:hypothetical protein